MVWKLIKNGIVFSEKCKKDNISAFAAQSAFFMLLSLIPFLMVFSSLLQYTMVSEATLMHLVKSLMPEYIAPFLVSIINEVYHKSVGIVSVTAVVAIWSAARGVQYIASGLNQINGIKETRNWVLRRFWAAVYTIVFLFAIVAILVLLVFGNTIQEILIGYVPFLSKATAAFFRFRGLILFVFMCGLFTILYRTLPNNGEIKDRKLTFRNQFPGAVLCAVIWYMFSFGVSIYVDYFNGFSMYGSLTTIVLVMLWLYFGMYIMLLCGEINVLFGEKVIEFHKKHIKK